MTASGKPHAPGGAALGDLHVLQALLRLEVLDGGRRVR
eukprot:CAMPEP_0113988422 /NCGR_PEP_ID=MMETSP0328-20130328/7501_1 /TAXON_ID=39455 /ORGANISM="Alexandrium minutum" /LENGTH=37 /assembly_acc=CAM_ASM_000350